MMMPWTQSWVSQLPQRWRTMPKRPYRGAVWPQQRVAACTWENSIMVPSPVLCRQFRAARMAAGDLGAGVPVDAPVGGLGGVAAEVLVGPGDAGQPGVGLPQDVVGAAEDLGAVAEAAAPDIDEPGVDLLDVAVALFPAVEGAVAVALGQAVGHLHQVVEDPLGSRGRGSPG